MSLIFGLIGLLIGSGIMYMINIRQSDTQPLSQLQPTISHNSHSQSMTMEDMNNLLKGKTGDEFDKAFITGMIEHHQGAIDMANAAKQNAKHEEIKRMADEIIAAQTKEIETMRQWQTQWGY